MNHCLHANWREKRRQVIQLEGSTRIYGSISAFDCGQYQTTPIHPLLVIVLSISRENHVSTSREDHVSTTAVARRGRCLVVESDCYTYGACHGSEIWTTVSVSITFVKISFTSNLEPNSSTKKGLLHLSLLWATMYKRIWYSALLVSQICPHCSRDNEPCSTCPPTYATLGRVLKQAMVRDLYVVPVALSSTRFISRSFKHHLSFKKIARVQTTIKCFADFEMFACW